MSLFENPCTDRLLWFAQTNLCESEKKTSRITLAVNATGNACHEACEGDEAVQTCGRPTPRGPTQPWRPSYFDAHPAGSAVTGWPEAVRTNNKAGRAWSSHHGVCASILGHCQRCLWWKPHLRRRWPSESAQPGAPGQHWASLHTISGGVYFQSRVIRIFTQQEQCVSDVDLRKQLCSKVLDVHIRIPSGSSVMLAHSHRIVFLCIRGGHAQVLVPVAVHR